MNKKVLVRTSQIHGKGVFAAVPVQFDEVVLSWTNTRELTSHEYEALPAFERNYIDIQAGKRLLVGEPERYVNHSCDANTRPGALCDIATREIAVGEEITTDYSQFFLPKGPFSCRCASSNCRGLIEGIPAEKIFRS